MPLEKNLKRVPRCGADRCLSLSALLAIGFNILAGAGSIRAEVSSPAPAVVIGPELRIQAGDDVPLTIGISNIEALPNQTVVIIKGLPTGIHLSEGKSFGSGVWVLPTNRLWRLKASVPSDAKSRAEISVAVVSLSGTYLTEKRTILVIVPPPSESPGLSAAGSAGRSETATTQSIQTALPPFRITGESRELALKLMTNGNNSMKASNVLLARQFYQHAAELGLAEAATALALTYDAEELARMKNLVDIRPDPELAKKWYEIANQLRSRDTATQAR